MKAVAGLSLFGLQDYAEFVGSDLPQQPFILEHAILPFKRSGTILTGEQAIHNRIHTGINWPLEARISRDSPIRRVPLSYIWRLLVEAGDRSATWTVGPNVSFSLAKIIAARTVSVLKQAADDDSPDKFMPVLAIPNHLDEYGQELLLREMSYKGYTDLKLLWRPVAIALSWLKSTEGDFIFNRMSPDDHIHVIYMGSDAIEFTTLRLRHRERDGVHYILPLRDRHHGVPNFSGLNWAEQLLKEYKGNMDHNGFWQAFSVFPEIWRAVAGKKFDTPACVRPWYESEKWNLWKIAPEVNEKYMDVPIGGSFYLKEIFSHSINTAFFREKVNIDETVSQFLSKEIRRMLNVFPEGELRGVVIAGPLASADIIQKLAGIGSLLEKRGLNLTNDCSTAEIDTLWICAHSNIPVAEGAKIYGERILAGIPAYLDTLPQLSILAREATRFVWVPLLDAEEVLGGEEYRDSICEKFRLNAGEDQLETYLNKGALHKTEEDQHQDLDSFDVPIGSLSPCKARLVRHVVKRCSSFEAFQQKIGSLGNFDGHGGQCIDYAARFARVFYEPDTQYTNSPEQKLTNSTFRRADFQFPVSPSENVNLDIEIRMKPVSGLAKVEILPDKPEFLRGHRVRLNYDKMQHVENIPKMGRGWPRTEEIICAPSDTPLKQNEWVAGRFEYESPLTLHYKTLIDSVRDKALKGSAEITFWGDTFWVNNIDHEGNACTPEGNQIIDRIARKFEKDFRQADISLKNKLFTRAAWLYFRTPSSIVTYIKQVINGPYGQQWNWAVQAAGRCFSQPDEYAILCKAVADRIREMWFDQQQLPIQSVRGVSKILLFRKDGEKGLNGDNAKLFAQEAVRRLRDEQTANNYQQLFFELIRFLLYLLRVRKVDNSCFQPEDSNALRPFEEAMKSMDNAIDYFDQERQFNQKKRTLAIMKGFDQYLKYQGSDTILPTLNKAAGGLH